MNNYDTVILDIEGTITPITFVKATLFPYVISGLESFLNRMWGSAELQEYIALLREQAKKDVEGKASLEAVLIPTESEASADEIKNAIKRNIRWQMEADRKIGALKSFQGYMWKEGYEAGILRGEIYDDVIPALDKWKATGKKIYIYSSGSVSAQKLLLTFSNKGDLSNYFDGYFDTAVGLKSDTNSYKNIAKSIGKENDTKNILFVTDNIQEIFAAEKAGYQVVISDRPNNAPLLPESKNYKIVSCFDQI
ncbi:2,3-diketo-5-methylthio-1-phosphopentane phosphatase [Mycotypha africana]|uniref:2,3-diketo-5-methylthio-1-phosphopentane phosphatase n=1 Tax=Mycotypha africana TaxID=64632 RepID=UPI002300094B|nr:2,3-diketo-5-methylthio-1-phosphopentane phosphatase [Mycotypha africana]KAI8969916.1 2,3-diketo-5-methylthio-1-phosphopentane phosphatase [Mycotypha africana]